MPAFDAMIEATLPVVVPYMLMALMVASVG